MRQGTNMSDVEKILVRVRVNGEPREALVEPRTSYLDEDYLAFVVSGANGTPSAEMLLEHHGADIAQLLRGERPVGRHAARRR